MAGFEANIRVARKSYRCLSGPYNVCNKKLDPGDMYFAFTHAESYKTNRYCLECALLYHGELMEKALSKMKQVKGKKSLVSPLGRIQ